MNNQVVQRVNDHTHAGDAAGVEMLTVRSNMKQRAEETEETPQQIITAGVQNMSDAASGAMTPITNVRRNIRRNRQRAGNQPPVPARAADVIIPRQSQMTARDGIFLRFDNGEGEADRILIYMSEDGQQCLATSDFWFADGTFKVVPEVFFQLYTIHSLTANGSVFPSVYALITNKRQDTHARVLQEVSAIAGGVNGLQPTKVLIDFERAAMNAILGVFPDVEVKGCFFHMTQNVYRQVNMPK
ncbi:uncharacterized protein LOC135493607 [Lineus longissimus]|uniref:uncharacterized protein LOC135493607 n=1 Tax=Lineus longissimus TaxID=88925 RepID=UPI00315D3C74